MTIQRYPWHRHARNLDGEGLLSLMHENHDKPLKSSSTTSSQASIRSMNSYPTSCKHHHWYRETRVVRPESSPCCSVSVSCSQNSGWASKSRSANIHLLPTPPLLPHIRHEVINDTWPGPILVPPAHTLIVLGLLYEHSCLVPHVLVDGLLPFLLQEFDPPVEPGCRLTSPLDAGGGEKEAPVVNGDVEGKDFRARGAGEDEGLLVGFLEEGGVGSEGATERGDVLLLLGECIGAV